MDLGPMGFRVLLGARSLPLFITATWDELVGIVEMLLSVIFYKHFQIRFKLPKDICFIFFSFIPQHSVDSWLWLHLVHIRWHFTPHTISFKSMVPSFAPPPREEPSTNSVPQLFIFLPALILLYIIIRCKGKGWYFIISMILWFYLVFSMLI